MSELKDVKRVTFILNGKKRTVSYEEGMTFLDVLRENCGIKSAKDGCSSQGFCGACTILVDGIAMLACVQKPNNMSGLKIVTLEGIPEREKKILAESFVKEGAIQCGFCTPGIMMRTKSFLDKNAGRSSSREEKAKAISGHLCRCTGYLRIIDAMETAEEHWKSGNSAGVLSNGKTPRRGDFFGEKYGLKRRVFSDGANKTGVGSNLSRYKGIEMALGKKPYIADMETKGMLHGALLLSKYPRAKILKIDSSDAEKSEGVTRVFTAEDVPGERVIGHIINDWPIFIAVGETTRCVGDVVAMVVADSMLHARNALSRIRVDYDELVPVCDPEKALLPDSAKIHDRGNLLETTVFSRGNVDKAFTDSRYIVKQKFRTGRIEHAFMEVESCLAVPKKSGVHVYSQGQGVHEDQRQIAAVLGVPIDKVTVELVSNGGAFGGKEDLSVQAQTAMAAFLLKKPVRTVLTRQQSMLLHPKRHPMMMEYEVGADASGKLLGARIRIIGDNGAYASVGAKVVERAAGHSCGPYYIPSVDVNAKAVYTNNPISGAMRGFGVNQTSFAIETILNMIAEKMRTDGIAIDEYDIRERNILRPGLAFGTGQIMTDTCIGLEKCLSAVKDVYKNSKAPVGIACGIKNTGVGNGLEDTGRVVIKVLPGGRLDILTGFTEMGQGLFTILQQVVSEITGISPSKMDVKSISYPDTKCGMTTASRATALDSMAAKFAAEKLLAAMKKTPLAKLAGKEFLGEYVTNVTVKPGANVDNPVTHLAFSYSTQVALLDKTGRVKKIIVAQDVGRAMNPLSCAGQIEGGVHMGLGHALTEEFPTTKGVPDSLLMRDLGIVKARDMPEVDVILIEEPEVIGGFGSKGVGELCLVPTAAAVTGALFHLDGKRRFELPIARKTILR